MDSPSPADLAELVPASPAVPRRRPTGATAEDSSRPGRRPSPRRALTAVTGDGVALLGRMTPVVVPQESADGRRAPGGTPIRRGYTLPRCDHSVPSRKDGGRTDRSAAGGQRPA